MSKYSRKKNQLAPEAIISLKIGTVANSIPA